MHEWLSGGVSPCQGEGRGFESRLVLFLCLKVVFAYKKEVDRFLDEKVSVDFFCLCFFESMEK